LLLAVVALAMPLFVALDIREAIHQGEESNTGLVILASESGGSGFTTATGRVFASWMRRPRRASESWS